MNWHITSTGIENCFRETNHIIEKFYAKLKVFGFKFHAGLRIKGEIDAIVYMSCTESPCYKACKAEINAINR